MDVSEIITRVKRQFGDEVGSQVTDADIIRWINDAQRDIAVNNQLFQTRATAGVAANQSTYTLPPDILTIHSVRFGTRKLQGISMQEAEIEIPDTGETGEPQKFWIWGGNVSLYPTPGTSDTDDLLIFYTRQPAPITTTADVLELPSHYHNRVVEYCLQQAYELDENWEAAQMKSQQFQQGVEKLRAEEEWTQRDYYPTISTAVGDYGYSGYDSEGW